MQLKWTSNLLLAWGIASLFCAAGCMNDGNTGPSRAQLSALLDNQHLNGDTTKSPGCQVPLPLVKWCTDTFQPTMRPHDFDTVVHSSTQCSGLDRTTRITRAEIFRGDSLLAWLEKMAYIDSAIGGGNSLSIHVRLGYYTRAYLDSCTRLGLNYDSSGRIDRMGVWLVPVIAGQEKMDAYRRLTSGSDTLTGFDLGGLQP